MSLLFSIILIGFITWLLTWAIPMSAKIAARPDRRLDLVCPPGVAVLRFLAAAAGPVAVKGIKKG